MNQEPNIEVGILHAPVIEVTFHGAYRCTELSTAQSAEQSHDLEGRYRFTFLDSHRISMQKLEDGGASKDIAPRFIADPLTLEQAAWHFLAQSGSTFTIHHVVIGLQFHWEREEDQTFEGAVRVMPTPEQQLVVINTLPLETYLLSVISSEMSAKASLELLKAHAVISRSWVLYQMLGKGGKSQSQDHQDTQEHTPLRKISWVDRSAHQGYDVCADDHCQRYQGRTRASSSTVREAIQATYGQVLSFEGELCDARYSKCCGGQTEKFSTCWGEEDFPYLSAVRDVNPSHAAPVSLSTEVEASAWILSSPKAFCQTKDAAVLSQVLNSYDRETPDFYRWTVHYSNQELSKLIKEKSGLDFGEILNLIPLKRGDSGRIYELKIEGSKRTMIFGKELEIRRLLSPSHLYSSAFVVEWRPDASGHPKGELFLHGAGWGHGVGLCQIGAAVMAHEGYAYQTILNHYFPKTQLIPYYYTPNHD